MFNLTQADEFSHLFAKLKDYVQEITNDHRLPEEAALAWWFCQAALLDADDKVNIEDSISVGMGGPDLGCDIIFASKPSQIVYICQVKFREKLKVKSEDRADINLFLTLAAQIFSSNKQKFDRFIKDGNPEVKRKLKEAYKLIRQDNYKLELIYITTGKFSDELKNQAETRIDTIKEEFCLPEDNLKYLFFDGEDCCKIFEYFEYDVPAIPSATLDLVGQICTPDDSGAENAPVCKVFTTTVKSICKLFSDHGDRLFARNVRLHVGDDSTVNKDISSTIKSKPEKFFYMNNGITILAHKVKNVDKSILVASPQIINGQQTTRQIGSFQVQDISKKAHVLVKVIVPPFQNQDSSKKYRSFIFDVVRATNSQNKISLQELFSNNREHILIEKNLITEHWHYKRKKGAYLKTPLRRIRPLNSVDIKELGLAVLANEHNPQICPSEGTTSMYDPNSPVNREFYDKVFDPNRKTNIILLNVLVARIAKDSVPKTSDRLIRSLHSRGAWYVSETLYKRVQRFFKKHPDKILAGLGHTSTKKLKAHKLLKQAGQKLHECWAKFFDAFGEEYRCRQKPQDFTKDKKASPDKWNKFLKTKCKTEIKEIDTFIKKYLASAKKAR